MAGIWTTFGFTDPGGTTTITKVELGTQHYLSLTASIIATMGREISWDGGSSWGSHVMDETTTEVSSETATIWVDCTADTAWTWTKLNDTNLQVRITNQQGNDTTAYTMYLDVIYVRVTYSSVTAISVTDTVGLADAVVRGRAFTVTDTSSLSDGVLTNKSLIEADTLTLSDSKLVNKTMSITDLLGLADAVFRGKAFTLTDTVGLTDAALKAVQLLITDSVALADSVLRDKALVISESIGLADTDSRDKALTETDALALLDTILLAAEKILTDAVSLDDVVEVEKTIPVIETTTGGGSSKPFRWTYIPTRKTPDELKARRKPTKPRLA